MFKFKFKSKVLSKAPLLNIIHITLYLKNLGKITKYIFMIQVSEKRKVLLDEKVVELQQVVEVSREKEQQMEEERREKEEQHQDTINRLSTETSQVNRDLELKIQVIPIESLEL